jgi:putative tryptophan/tyrosine transport system substrate-binding protein
MRRRDVIKVAAASAFAWPLAGYAQKPAIPVIGFVNSAFREGYEPQVAAFLKGLGETGFVQGRNVAIEYRWAEGRNDRLPALVADLVSRQVNVITATSTPAAVAAKAATTTIPIVFEGGADPIKVGLVSRLDRPGGNITGITQLNIEVGPKRLELLQELVPRAGAMAYLLNPADRLTDVAEVQATARRLGIEVHLLNASNDRDIEAGFTSLPQLRVGALAIGSSAFFVARQEQLATLAVRGAMPAAFENRQFVAAGGLMSYGGRLTDAYYLAGVYTGRILKGEKPSELPVQQATKVELFINLKSARALGLSVPPTLQARADEIIE